VNNYRPIGLIGVNRTKNNFRNEHLFYNNIHIANKVPQQRLPKFLLDSTRILK